MEIAVVSASAVSMAHPWFGWWRRVRGQSPERDITDDVKDAAADLRSIAGALNAKLEGFQKAPDPFVAMLADIYERRQEAVIYKEALKDWRGEPE